MRKLKQQKGITLVALVITIIILIILAGISISALSGSGLFARAQQAQKESENAQANEDATLAEYDQWMTNYIGGSSSGGGTTTYTAYTRGQTVTVENKDGVEQIFYVLHDSSSSEATVTLLAEKNIKTSTLLQGDDANIIAFSANNGWAAGDDLNGYNNGSLKTDGSSAVYYAVQYGGKFEGATGRLMTAGDVVALGGDVDNADISACPSWITTTNYWLGSARSADRVWGVAFGDLYRISFDDDNDFGVRPVIEISKSSIQ